MADLHDQSKSGQSVLVDDVASEEVRIVGEIAEEPAEFAQCFCSAIDAPRNHTPSEFVRFKDRQTEDVEWFCWMPAVLCTVDADKENAVGHGIGGRVGRLVQAVDSTFHAAPSLLSPRGR